ncbi:MULTISPECIES: hypothetical protein [unclassified Leifsonia]|uniref:hypothetical protein n=1 Tax=unclassified Leifsonia TaxID=2663824 RepID=UPI0007009F8C|nr:MULTISPECIES: hypothetical protein [unclassified Leifsonia]KQX07309.1 hypothetical protein ASC59_05885 [Leifsonia sp. Root1293]KRA11592.1 hypothetical protein ASD61_05885 [Leifsonia sp. Root60]
MRRFLTLLFVAAILAVGYVYGSKAGKGPYRDVMASLDALWNDPRVKKARKHALKDAQNAAKAAEKKIAKAAKGKS